MAANLQGSLSMKSLAFALLLVLLVAPAAVGQAGPTIETIPLEGVRIEKRTNETRVVIDLGAPVHLTYEKVSKPNRLYMYLWRTEPGAKLKYGRRPVNDLRLTATTVDEWPIGTRVALDLKSGTSYTIVPGSKPPRIVVVLSGSGG